MRWGGGGVMTLILKKEGGHLLFRVRVRVRVMF